ncbi:MAG: hypothetical protein IMZ71_01510 [Chloroflexi bacterium]|nr:hypothetical protein [Chloroflexota bacterium]
MPAPKTNYTPEQIAWRDATAAALEARGIPADGRSFILEPRTRKIYVPDENAHNLGKVREVASINDVVLVPWTMPLHKSYLKG